MRESARLLTVSHLAARVCIEVNCVDARSLIRATVLRSDIRERGVRLDLLVEEDGFERGQVLDRRLLAETEQLFEALRVVETPGLVVGKEVDSMIAILAEDVPG